MNFKDLKINDKVKYISDKKCVDWLEIDKTYRIAGFSQKRAFIIDDYNDICLISPNDFIPLLNKYNVLEYKIGDIIKYTDQFYGNIRYGEIHSILIEKEENLLYTYCVDNGNEEVRQSEVICKLIEDVK